MRFTTVHFDIFVERGIFDEEIYFCDVGCCLFVVLSVGGAYSYYYGCYAQRQQHKVEEKLCTLRGENVG